MGKQDDQLLLTTILLAAYDGIINLSVNTQ